MSRNRTLVVASRNNIDWYAVFVFVWLALGALLLSVTQQQHLNLGLVLVDTEWAKIDFIVTAVRSAGAIEIAVSIVWAIMLALVVGINLMKSRNVHS